MTSFSFSFFLLISSSYLFLGLSRDLNFKKAKTQINLSQNNLNNKQNKQNKQNKVYEFDEELNNLKARNGIFSNKKKTTVITLAPSVLSSFCMKPPIDISNSNSNSNSESNSTTTNTTTNIFIQQQLQLQEQQRKSKIDESNIYSALQEPDPVSFQFALQPSLLSKYNKNTLLSSSLPSSLSTTTTTINPQKPSTSTFSTTLSSTSILQIIDDADI